MSCLGPKALDQIRATGYDVDKQIAREQAGKRARGLSVLIPRDNKYGVSAKDERTLDGIVFASKLEMNAYRYIRDLGVVFERQVPFVLMEGFEHSGKKVLPIRYVCDFVVQANDGQKFIIDTKGVLTAECRLKLKLMLSLGHVVHCVRSVGAIAQFLHEHNCVPNKHAQTTPGASPDSGGVPDKTIDAAPQEASSENRR